MYANIARKQFGHEQGRSRITIPSRPGHGGGCRSAVTRLSGGLSMKRKSSSDWKMKRNNRRGTARVGLAMGCAVVCFAAARPALAQCGPGAHWIDGCGAGTDTLPMTGARLGIDINLDNLVETNLALGGSTTISRTGALTASANFPTVTGPPGHVGPDVIDTEIVSMDLKTGGGGIHLKAGHTLVPTLQHTLGTIAEQAGNPAKADSFFDVYFQFEISPGTFVYNHVPLRVTLPIDRVPPDNGEYGFVLTTPLGLFSQPVGGVEVARLVSGQHDTFVPAVSEWGLIVMTLIGLALGTVFYGRRRVARG